MATELKWSSFSTTHTYPGWLIKDDKAVQWKK
jgi:hypothetical protein